MGVGTSKQHSLVALHGMNGCFMGGFVTVQCILWRARDSAFRQLYQLGVATPTSQQSRSTLLLYKCTQHLPRRLVCPRCLDRCRFLGCRHGRRSSKPRLLLRLPHIVTSIHDTHAPRYTRPRIHCTWPVFRRSIQQPSTHWSALSSATADQAQHSMEHGNAVSELGRLYWGLWRAGPWT